MRPSSSQTLKVLQTSIKYRRRWRFTVPLASAQVFFAKSLSTWLWSCCTSLAWSNNCAAQRPAAMEKVDGRNLRCGELVINSDKQWTSAVSTSLLLLAYPTKTAQLALPKRCHFRAKSTQLCRSSERSLTCWQKSAQPVPASPRNTPSHAEAAGSNSSFPGVTCNDSCIL